MLGLHRVSMGAFLFSATLVAVGAASVLAADGTPLQALAWRYRVVRPGDPGSIHVVAVNSSGRPVQLDWIRVNGRAVEPPGNVADPAMVHPESVGRIAYPRIQHGGQPLWAWLSARRLALGAPLECIVRFASPPTGPVTLELGQAEACALAHTIAPRPETVRISAVNFDKDLRNVYAYVENRGAVVAHVRSARLLGCDAGTLTKAMELKPGAKRCIHFTLDEPLQMGGRVYVLAELAEGLAVGGSAAAYPFFPIEPVSGGKHGLAPDLDGASPEMLLGNWKAFHCPQDVVGYRIMDALSQPGRWGGAKLPYAVTSQAFSHDAVLTLGELAPCFHLACEPLGKAYVGPYDARDYHYLQAKARFIKEAVSPNLPWLGMRIAHGYDDFRKPMQPVELRLRVAYLVSRGAKGVFYWLHSLSQYGQAERDALCREIQSVNGDLLALRPLLRIAEPVDGVAETSEPLVEAAALLAGDRAMIVLMLNHDRTFAWPEQEMDNAVPFHIAPKPDPIAVSVALPPGHAVREVFEVGGAWAAPQFRQERGRVDFTVDRLHAVRQFVVSFSENASRADLFASADADTRLKMTLGEVAPPPTASDRAAPDIVFNRKQFFFGTVDPLQERVAARYVFRNAGRADLRVSLQQSAPNLSVEAPAAPVAAGCEGVVTAQWRARGHGEGKVSQEILLAANDPNEPEIRLLFAGVVRRELTYAPEAVSLNARGGNAVVTLLDGRDGALKIEDVSSDMAGLTWAVRRMTIPGEDAYSEAYRWKRMDYGYEIVLKFAGNGGAGKGVLRIRTNAPRRRDVIVPIEVSR